MSTPTIPSPSRPSSHLSNVHPPFARADIHAIKQELHDALGENGLPYWKALNGYLLGKIGRGELGEMVQGWLKGDKVALHNRLLISLLSNASAPPQSSSSSLSPLNVKKRKRLGPDHPQFDTDENNVEPKARVQSWMMGISGKERARLRRVALGPAEDEGEEPKDPRGKGAYLPNPAMPPISLPSRLLPSSSQLSQRLASLAKAYDLALPPESISEIGEFMAIGIDSHISDILHSVVRLTGRDRSGGDTVRIPKGTNPDHLHVGSNGMDYDHTDVKLEPLDVNGEVPKPDLETVRSLFLLEPGLHPPASPALYKLATSLTRSEAMSSTPPVKEERKPSLPPSPGETRVERTSARLLDSGLLKLDKAGRDGEGKEGEGKKERKHNLHWKYEDPALILRDVLG